MKKNEAMRYAESIRDDINRLYNGEPVDGCEDLTDYVFEALEVEYALNTRRELVGVKVFVTLGGPTCWVDTRTGAVECRWGLSHGCAVLGEGVADAILEIFREGFIFSE